MATTDDKTVLSRAAALAEAAIRDSIDVHERLLDEDDELVVGDAAGTTAGAGGSDGERQNWQPEEAPAIF